MKLKTAADFYGSEYKLAKALGIHRSCLTRWKNDVVPMYRAWQLHNLTDGKLRFNPKEYTVR